MKRSVLRVGGICLVAAASSVSLQALAAEGPYIGLQFGINRLENQDYQFRGQHISLAQPPSVVELPLIQNFGDAGTYKYPISAVGQLVFGDSTHYRPFGSLLGLRPEIELSLRRDEPNHIFYSDGTTGSKTGVRFSTTSGLANLWLDLFPDSPIRPYVGAGAGVARFILNNGQFNPPSQGFTAPDSRKADDTTGAFQAGAGVNWDVWGPVTVGLDYRYFRSLRGDLYPYKDQPQTFVSTTYKAQSLLFSVHYYFAPPPKPAPVTPPPVVVVPVVQPVDTDGDGVPDSIDQCPGTPPGTKVDAKGCPLPPPCKTPAPGEKISLAGCGTGDSIVLNGVNFHTDKSTLTLNAKTILDNVASELKTYSGIQVEIDGFTDNKGKPKHNQGLSERRADSVKAYLTGAGIAESRMTTAGFGETQPIADNETEDGRASNRRVQLKITQGSTSQNDVTPSSGADTAGSTAAPAGASDPANAAAAPQPSAP